MSEDRPTYSAPALEKGLDILEILAREGRPLNTRQIAEKLGRSTSEIFRMVHVLLDRGYLQREDSGEGLTLSNQLFSLGMQTARARDLVSVAAPIVEQFAAEVRQAAHLVVAHRGEAVIIAAVSGGSDMNFALKLGYRRPLADAHSGLVLMAFQPEHIRNRMIADCQLLMALPPDPATLEEAMQEARELGGVIHESRDIIGVTDVVCPIVMPDGRAVACVTVAAFSRRNSPPNFEAMHDRLKLTCAKIARELGSYTPEPDRR
ncbi:IclR family transcriptional regulator [Frigidibacter sp. ROC022]|uniref:IclR family transcriptional regulator n=1 Tax=Frigidibacter sp. ROC022 TaxID=2971796 RepID=UPI00215AC809|nr:IclR family transcriptional regulator [Frigidibacter sp. ROC022]MCR8725998.1 IclR family transcriptional regulator [Frigidibacter sp. ROC022]